MELATKMDLNDMLRGNEVHVDIAISCRVQKESIDHQGSGVHVIALLTFAFLLTEAISAAICAHSADVQPQAQGVRILRVGASHPIMELNILADISWRDADTTAILARVYDTAIQRDPVTGAVIPRLAVGVDVNGNGLREPGEIGNFDIPTGSANVTVFFDFKNAYFHDGVPVTIMDVVFSYHVMALDPRTSRSLRVLMDLGGLSGSNFSASHWLWALPVDDNDADPLTAALRFTLQFQYGNFAWATLGIPILPRHIWEGTGSGRHQDFGLAIYPDADPRAGHGVPSWETTYTPFSMANARAWRPYDADVIGSGHFRFVSFNPYGEVTRLDSYERYAFGTPKYGGIEYQTFDMISSAISALQAKQIDVVLTSIPQVSVPLLWQTPNVTVVEAPDEYPVSVNFNMLAPPWGYDSYPPLNRSSDVGVVLRKAVAHLVDRQWMVDNLSSGNAVVADSMVSPANDGWFNASVPKYDFNISAAVALLDSPEALAAGISADPPGPCGASTPSGCRMLRYVGRVPFKLRGPTDNYDPAMANLTLALAENMRAVGLDALAWPMAFDFLEDELTDLSYDMMVMPHFNVHAYDPWTLMRGDPEYLFDFFHSSGAPGGQNADAFYDAEFDSHAEAILGAPDPSSRLDHVLYAQSILADREPSIPLYFRDLTWAYRDDTFTGWRLVGSTIFNYWSLQELQASPNPGPTVTLLSPLDGSVIKPGVPIRFQVLDTDLVDFAVVLDGTVTLHPSQPYEVDTTAWADGAHSLAATARDSVDNTTTVTCGFTVDSVAPGISLTTPVNNSLVPAETNAIFDINELHLENVTLSVDGGTPVPFAMPYTVPLDVLPDGGHKFTVVALDSAGNRAERWFGLSLDKEPPQVVEYGPTGDSVAQDAVISIRFTEPMNRTSAELAFVLSDGDSLWGSGNGTFSWADGNESFTFTPDGGLGRGRSYSVEIRSSARDVAGNRMVQASSWSFIVRGPDSNPFWMIAVILATIITMTVIWVAWKRRRRKIRGENEKDKA